MTTRLGWKPHRMLVTYEEVLTDRRLWSTMFFRDWDRIPSSLRDTALDQMLARFGRLVDGPDSWLCMKPTDWDGVPQPIRAMAFMNMLARWEHCLGVSERFALPRERVVARLRAIAIAESWFEHRASNQNRAPSPTGRWPTLVSARRLSPKPPLTTAPLMRPGITARSGCEVGGWPARYSARAGRRGASVTRPSPADASPLSCRLGMG